MIIGDYTTQYIRVSNNPIEKILISQPAEWNERGILNTAQLGLQFEEPRVKIQEADTMRSGDLPI